MNRALVTALVAAVIVLIVIVVVLFAVDDGGAGGAGGRCAAPAGAETPAELVDADIYAGLEKAVKWPSAAATKSGFANFTLDAGEPMFISDEVDARITGNLYRGERAAGRGRRLVYTNRSAHSPWGLREFSSGLPGEPGVDVGPLESGDVFDDGIPGNWQMPSTPVQAYEISPGAAPIYRLSEPDHEPLFN